MPQPVPYPHSTWFFKFCECLLAAIAVTNTLMMATEAVPSSFWETHEIFSEYILPFIDIVIPLVSAVVFSIVWHRRERAGRVDSGLRHAWLQGIIRYWLALSISTYGFAKILKTQFQSPDYRLDMPMGDVNGFGLTWYYFGYSYTLAVIIALFQIGGSILLLYRRTTLLGVMILLPVMVNIVFINLFFSIASGAFFNSVVFTLGLTFLLLLDINKLKAAFWDLIERLPPVNMGGNWGKHGLRFLPIVAAFSFVLFLVRTNENETVLKGTWKVVNMTRNGQILQSDAWLTDTTAWNRIYFAGWQGCAFSPNPYRYKPAESWRGKYEFDSTKNTLRLMMFQSDTAKVPDTIQLAVSNRTAKSMRLQGVFHRDTVDMSLVRLR
ncbi:MAG: hypothetical protein H7319_00605 [Spirosoma sp.]|nr:hypothetical protein [Spirosoma sp.]